MYEIGPFNADVVGVKKNKTSDAFNVTIEIPLIEGEKVAAMLMLAPFNCTAMLTNVRNYDEEERPSGDPV